MGRAGIRSGINGMYLEQAVRDGVDLDLLDRPGVTLAAKAGVPETLIVFSDHAATPESQQARAAGLSWGIPVLVFPAGC